MESAEFTFFYVGEHIIHYQPRLFFKHRGMETRFEGVRPDHAVLIAERVSAVGTVCHALAFCEAVERAAGCEVPVRARALRVLLAELERLYNHLHYLGHLCNTTTLKVGEAQGKLLEEKAISPTLDQVFPFSKAGAAHERIEGRSNVGKVVLVPG